MKAGNQRQKAKTGTRFSTAATAAAAVAAMFFLIGCEPQDSPVPQEPAIPQEEPVTPP